MIPGSIAKAADEVTVEDGREVVTQDAVGKEAFIIVEGTAHVDRSGTRVATLGIGDHFGELSLLDGGPRTATVVADGELKLLVLGQREFNWVLGEVPGLATKIMRSMAGIIRDLDQKIYP